MKKILFKIGGIVSGIIPTIALAQGYIGSQTTNGAWGSIKDIVESVGKFISGTVMPIIVALGILYFMWNIVHFIGNMSNEQEREAFKKYSLNGILALFVMLSVWGIVAIGTQTLFGSQPVIPQFKTNPNGGTTPP